VIANVYSKKIIGLSPKEKVLFPKKKNYKDGKIIYAIYIQQRERESIKKILLLN